jgi:hypothetical protein
MRCATGLLASLLWAGVACSSGSGPPADARPTARDQPSLSITGIGTLQRDGDPAPTPFHGYDGHRLAVRLARGESLALQIVTTPPAKMSLDLPIGLAASLRPLDPVTVSAPSTAMYGGSRGPGRYRDRIGEPTDAPMTHAVLAFEAPAQVGAPTANTTLRIGAWTIPVEVTIVEAAIAPLATGAPRAWAYYDPRELAADGALAPDSPELWARERACAKTLRAYGVMATPELTLDDADRRAEAVAGSPFVPVLLPRDEAGVTATVQAWVARTRGSGQVPFAIPVDEPRTPAARAEALQFGRWVRAAGGGPGAFLLAVTTARAPGDDELIDLYISPLAVSQAAAVHRRTTEPWTYNGKPPRAGAMVVDAAPSSLRTWGWIAYRWRVPLWYIWDGLYWHDRHNQQLRRPAPLPGPPLAAAADRSAVTFDDGEDRGNLDGVIAFPAGGERGCAPSLRLLQLARGFTDAAMLEALAARGRREVADELAATMVPKALADATSSCCRARRCAPGGARAAPPSTRSGRT